MENKGFIGVHLGAGYHSHSKDKLYKAVCKKALEHGMKLIRNGEPASRIVTAVVSILEDSPLTNAGTGSNLTVEGKVECDAGIMEGESGLFSGIGAVSNVKNPIRVAEELLYYQKENGEASELVPPIVLVGEGATDFAASQEIETVDGDDLITDMALRTYEKCHFRLQGSTAKSVVPGAGIRGAKRVHHEEVSESESSFGDDDHSSVFSGDGTVDINIDILGDFSGTRKEEARPSYSNHRLRSKRQRHNIRGKGLSDVREERIKKVKEVNSGKAAYGVINNHDIKYGKDVSERRRDSTDIGDKEARYDTVGAVCVDCFGTSCAGISSGGLILKLPGRVGHAAMFGSGCWANSDEGNGTSTASCTSGCGEQILRTFLAKECCDFLDSVVDDEMLNPSSFFKRKFLNCKFLVSEEDKLAGVIGLFLKRGLKQATENGFKTPMSARNNSTSSCDKTRLRSHGSQSREEENKVYILDDDQAPCAIIESSTDSRAPKHDGVTKSTSDNTPARKNSDSDRTPPTTSSLEFIIAHSTHSFCVGFFGGNDTSPTVMVSRMPSSDLIGKSVSGHVFHYDW